MRFPSCVPDPCSPHDEVLKQLATLLEDPNESNSRGILRSLIWELRQVERHRIEQLYMREML